MAVSTAKGCTSETGTLRKVIMCRPTQFRIVSPINAVQWLYYYDGHVPPNSFTMVRQHDQLVEILREQGVEIELLPPVRDLPYQHATRDIGVVVGDAIVLSDPRDKTRRLEAQVAEPLLQKYGLRTLRLTPEQGFIEGGDVIVDGERIWVGLGSRTDERGVQFLYDHFGQDYDVVPLRFSSAYTHLDTVFGILGHGRALLYEPVFEEAGLQKIKKHYPAIISLSKEEQQNAGANVLCLGPDKVVSIAENQSVNERLVQLGYEVVTLPYSEVIKSGGSVRCDTLPVERE